MTSQRRPDEVADAHERVGEGLDILDRGDLTVVHGPAQGLRVAIGEASVPPR